MSKFSSFLHSTVGIQEIDLSRLPFASKVIGTLELTGARWLVAQMDPASKSAFRQALTEDADRIASTKGGA